MLDITINGVALTGYVTRATMETQKGYGGIRMTMELELLLPPGMDPSSIQQSAVTEGPRRLGDGA